MQIKILTKIISGLLLLVSGYLFYLLHKSTLLQLIIPNRLSLSEFYEKSFNILFALFLLSCVFFAIQLIYLFKQPKNMSRYVGLSIFSFVFTLLAYFAITNYFSCRSIFQFCKDGWHYEKNFLGQKVDVHYKIDLNGKRINPGDVGCGFYDDTPKNWDRLVMSLPNVKKIDENDDRIIYKLDNGTIGQINKNKKPYADDALSFAVSNIMFKGTSCETNMPLGQDPFEPKIYDSLRIKTIFKTDDWNNFEQATVKEDYAYTFEYPSNWISDYSVFSDSIEHKLAELSPGAVLLKPGQKCFDKKYDETLILERPIKIGGLNGALKITEVMYEGGSPDWNGIWYPNTYCLVDKDKAFVITFYEYEKVPKNSSVYEKILSTLKFYPVNK